MDRNFRTFLIMSLAMLLIFVGLQRLFLPNVPPKAAQQMANKEQAKEAVGDTEGPKTDSPTAPASDEPAADKPAADTPDQAAAIEPKAAESTSADAAKPEAQSDTKVAVDSSAETKADESKPTEPNPGQANAVEANKPAIRLEQVTSLGSMDPSKGYRLLVTATTRGGAIERIELVDEKKVDRFRYRAIEHRGGYLGYLGWRPTDGGVLILTVPDASPANLAKCTAVPGGLTVGDVLTSLNGIKVMSYDGVQRLLKDLKPGKTVALEVIRTINGVPTQLSFTTELSQPPLDVLRTQEYLAEQVPGNLQRLSCLTTLASVGTLEIPIGMRSIKGLESTLIDNWEMATLNVPGGQGVEFRLPLADALKDAGLPADLVLVKRYRLRPLDNQASDAKAAAAEAYTLDFETVVENRGDQAVNLSVRHEALAGITLEGWWYSVKVSPDFFRGVGQRDVRYCDAKDNHYIVSARSIFDRELKTPADEGLFVNPGGTPTERTLKYVGLDAQYFATAFLPHPEAPDSLKELKQAGTDAVARVSKIVGSQAQAVNTAMWFESNERSVEPKDSFTTRYRIFAGPKEPGMLNYFGLDRFIEYGWIPYIAKPLSLILYIFYSVVRNYGIAIIMLTILVRGCMFPLGRQAAINGQKMQELQPELKRINDLYKDDMQKRAEAMRELYAKHNFRPLSGCLPLFIQLPIFTGLYRCLSVDISLRQEPLIPGLSWCSNLSGPDMLFDWSGWMPEIIAGRGTGYLGPYFNLLPVITIVLFLVQQKVLMPKATDEQMQMTQNMMQIMTVVMGVLFFKVPSGLCIYFITSSLWSLAERQLVKRLVPPKPAGSSPPTPSPVVTATSTSNKRKEQKEPAPQSGFAKKLQELKEILEKPAVKSGTQRRDERKKKK